MRIVLRDFQPQELVQVEKSGTRILMHITTFTINPEISEAQLELHVPAGTKVTHPLK
jgi:outer membrane lipoprotein-sorting protein